MEAFKVDPVIIRNILIQLKKAKIIISGEEALKTHKIIMKLYELGGMKP